VEQDKFIVHLETGKLQVEVPEDAFFLEGLQVAKQTITADIGKFFPKVETVTFIENFKKPAATLAATPTAQPSTAEAPAATAPTPAST
jgi:hypothetical protein